MALNDLPDIIKDNYEFIRVIGKGNFGSVYLVEERSSIIELALKIIETNDSQSFRDVKLLQRLNYPNLVRLYDLYYANSKIFLFMDYMRGGSLRKRLKKNKGKLKPSTAKLYFYQICKAVNYLHWNGIIHGNIRPENILLADEQESTLLKLSEYGLSLNYYTDKNCMISCSSIKPYIAPEVLNSQEPNSCSTKIDIWSLGVLLHECLKGKYPTTSTVDTPKTSWSFRSRTLSSIPDSAKSTMETMLEVNPNRRFNIEEVLLCFWLDDTEMKRITQNISVKYSKIHQ